MQTKDRRKLTQRKTDIMGRVTLGLLDKEIAHQLGISEQTVKNQLSTIRQKLNVHNRVQITLVAVAALLEKVAKNMFMAGFNLGITIDRDTLKDSHSQINSLSDLKSMIRRHFGEN